MEDFERGLDKGSELWSTREDSVSEPESYP